MANEEHLAKLKQGVAAWNEWRRAQPHSLVPDLREAKLTYADLRRADLHETNLINADLSHADFSKADLSGAFLNLANLCGANLYQADLTEAILGGARLREARFDGAMLNGTNLVRADLTGARFTSTLTKSDFEKAKLDALEMRKIKEGAGSEASLAFANDYFEMLSVIARRLVDHSASSTPEWYAAGLSTILARGELYAVDLREAILHDVDMRWARVGKLNWNDMDLSEIAGLDTIKHEFPSSVGIDTLTKSSGRIPDGFLRGCGLSDWQIEEAKLYNPELTPEQVADIQCRVFELRTKGVIQISPIFVSYSHGDCEFVDALGEALDERGVRHWRDVKDATAGPLDKVIERGISLNPTVLLVLSKHSLESDWVEFEVSKAVELSKKLRRDVLCPVALDAAWLESTTISGRLREQIRKYVVLDFAKWQDDNVFAAQFKKLFEGLGLHYANEPAKAPTGEPG